MKSIESRRFSWSTLIGLAIALASVPLLAVRDAGAQTSAITLVQHVGKDAGTATGSTLAFASGNGAGNWIGVAIRAGVSGEAFTVNDSNGNVYRQAVQLNITVDTPMGDTLAIFYAENIKGGANTVTIAASASATLRFAILEYAGVALTNSLDSKAAAQGTSATASSGSATTTAAGDLLLSAIASANGRTFTAGSGYVIQERVPAAPNSKFVVEHQIQAAAGAVSAGASVGTSDNWGATLAAFRAASGGGGGGDTQAPTTPASAAATAASTTQINVAWTASTDNVGVTSYLIERCQGAGCSTFAQVATAAGTSYSDAALTASTSYSYRVRSKDAAGNLSGYSNIAGAATPAPTDTQAPTTPASLAATASSNSQINLSWTASTDNVGVTGYRVERCQGAGCSNFTALSTTQAQIAGPLTASANPNYFKDSTGTSIILTGSHTWNSLQDWGSNGSLQTVDFPAFVNFLVAHGHNMTYLWRTEMPKFCGMPTTASNPPDFTVGPHPWRRTGPGTATDGGAKFDLSSFDQAYFDRLRARTQALNAAGIYAGVYLFTGEWLNVFRCTTDGYPFTGANNVNGIDDGYAGGSTGVGSMTMNAPNAITAFQDAFVEKVIDTLSDLPNVLWLISEEAPTNSTWWNDHQIAHIRAYEAGKPTRHPIGYGTLASLTASDPIIINSQADWINPGTVNSPTTSCGSGTPRCKVNVNDSDHSNYGMWNNSADSNRYYAWNNFLSGNQVVFMDPYVLNYPREGRNLCASPINGVCAGPDTRWDNFRDNLGAMLRYSRKLNLANVLPASPLCSTNVCLAQTPSVGAEYLVYAPFGGSFTVNLSAMSSARTLTVEWYNPSTGATIAGAAVPAGSSSRSFVAPFSGDAVLYLVDSAGHAAAPPASGTTFSDSGLAAATSYSYQVRAVDAAGNVSAASSAATAVTPAASDTQAPTAPASLTATVAASSQINLNWPASADNVAVTSYLVERCQGAGCTNFAQVGTASGTSYTSGGLAASTSYSYRVRATDAANNLSGYSPVAGATTTGGATASITLVQHTSKDAGTTASSSLAFASNNTAGNWIAVAIRAGEMGQGFTVTDTRGNTYRKAIQLNETVDRTSLALYYAENIAGGSNTVTVADTIAGATLRFALLEYSGLATANSLDVASTAQGTSAAAASGSATTTSSGDLIIGIVSTANPTTATAASGYAIEERVPAAPSTKLAVEDQRQSTAGAVSAAMTLSASDNWGAIMAAFRPAATAPSLTSDLVITKTHAGDFVQGQTGAAYSLGVSNRGTGPTAGVVTIADALPAGLTATALSGAGWTCSLGTLSCTRSDALSAGASYPVITLTVTVAGTADASVTNTATVSGGGDADTTNNAASDVTMIAPDTEAPGAPGTLTAVAASGTRVDLSWGAASDNVGAVAYRVERCQGSGCTDFVKLQTVAGTVLSDGALTPNTSYTYIVRAKDATGNEGPYSNAATVTTLSTIPELVAAYSFNEGSGTTVSDASGYGNSGTIANATWTTAGAYGRALVFNGTTARITIPDSASLHLTSGMTLEAWVNPSTVSSAWRDVIYKGTNNYDLEATSTTGGRPAAGATISSSNGWTIGTASLPVNTWTHLAATYDGAELRLYVNGVQVASQPRTGNILTSTSALEIGGNAATGHFFQGLIDEVRVFNVALTPTQIQSDMNTPVGGTFPVVSLSAGSVDFGSQPAGTTSSARTVTLTNTGDGSLTIQSVAVTGANSANFAQSNTCGSSVAPGGTCVITTTFTPSAAGGASAAVTIADNAPGTPHTIALAGTGGGFLISPRTTVVTPIETRQFTFNGTGSVEWSVDGVVGGTAASGTISGTGVYSPPNTAGTHTVTVATTDHLQSSTATVYVTSYAGTLTHYVDNFRTGQNLNETVLTPANVSSATFGKLFSYPIDGIAHASPLYLPGVNVPGKGLRNVVYIATEHDSVYAFDGDGQNTTALWQVSFINPAAGVNTVPAADTSECCDIAPEIGITGTPVIDQSSGTLYVVAKTKEVAAGTTRYVHRLHALDTATGAEKFGGPVVLQASVTGTGNGSNAGRIAFDSLHQNQRTGLLLNNGVVYLGFASHGDIQPYHGWILGYNAATLQQVLVYNTTPNGEGGGIWQGGAGLAADAAGNIYFVTGDGKFDASSGGKDYGDSFVKISPDGTVLDYFTPSNQGSLDASDLDLGSADVLLLPDQSGTHPHLVVSAGKNASMFLIDRDNMGHFNSGNNDQAVQSLINIFPHGTPEPGNYSAPVYFNGTVYFSPVADTIQAFRLTNGLFNTVPASRSSDVYAYPGGTLAISANGSANAILWSVERNATAVSDADSSSAGVLHAYDPADLATELYNSTQAGTRDKLSAAAKFSAPLVANGKVFVATVNSLTVYGLIP